jgi:hypothetical protein
VLYLATSSVVASALYTEVTMAVAPLKTVQMLDLFRAGFAADSAIHHTSYCSAPEVGNLIYDSTYRPMGGLDDADRAVGCGFAGGEAATRSLCPRP